MKLMLTAALASTAMIANAGIIFEDGTLGGGNNVLSGSIEGPAVVVKGELNNHGAVIVFTNNDGYAMTYTGGQATLEADDDDNGPLMDFTIGFEDGSLSALAMGLSLDADDDGMVTFTAVTNEGSFSDTLAYDKSGENKYRILASDTTQILSLRVETSTALDDVKQVRIDAVPEPGTMAAVGLGLAAFARRRNRR